jgi:CRP/FNR family transcriptional regulator, dissimilatory nitrate respiration regulator
MFEELNKTLIFQRLTPEEIKGCLGKIKYKVNEYSKGETIAFREEELGELIIILDGMLKAEMVKINGKSFKIEDLGKNQVVAPAFLFGKNPLMPVDLIASENSKLLEISRVDFIKLLQLDERILENFLNALSNKAQFLSKKIWFLNKSLEEKLAEYILKNLDENSEIKLKKSVKDLAQEFNVARPSLSRILKKWVEDGSLERVTLNHFKVIDSDEFLDKF